MARKLGKLVLLPSTPDEKAKMKDVHYGVVVGSVMYALMGTRPDLAFGMSVLSTISSISESFRPCYTCSQICPLLSYSHNFDSVPHPTFQIGLSINRALHQ